MRRLVVAPLLLAVALGCWAQSRLFLHRVVMNFAPQSSELPPDGTAVLRSMLADSQRECLEAGYVTVVVEEVMLLPLGKTTSGGTPRTQAVAAAIRELSNKRVQPYDGSLSQDSVRAQRLGLKPNQVLVELTCPSGNG